MYSLSMCSTVVVCTDGSTYARQTEKKSFNRWKSIVATLLLLIYILAWFSYVFLGFFWYSDDKSWWWCTSRTMICHLVTENWYEIHTITLYMLFFYITDTTIEWKMFFAHNDYILLILNTHYLTYPMRTFVFELITSDFIPQSIYLIYCAFSILLAVSVVPCIQKEFLSYQSLSKTITIIYDWKDIMDFSCVAWYNTCRNIFKVIDVVDREDKEGKRDREKSREKEKS